MQINNAQYIQEKLTPNVPLDATRIFGVLVDKTITNQHYNFPYDINPFDPEFILKKPKKNKRPSVPLDKHFFISLDFILHFYNALDVFSPKMELIW